MQREMNHSGSLSGRRDFIKSAGAAAAGLYLGGANSLASAQEPAKTAASGKSEVLALNGGPKAVAAPIGSAVRWPLYGAEEEKDVLALLRSPSYSPIAEFEKAWAEYHKTPLCKAHCNGTNALTSMWFALDLPPGSKVLIPDLSTWFPVTPMRFFDLVPVFVDVNPRTLNIDVEDCKRRLTQLKDVRAIMPVHWFGLPCDMDHVCDFAKEHGLEVVEDASHAHGASVKGRLVGTWGRMSGFSLQSSKPVPAMEGGIAMYQNRLDYERAVTYGNYDLPITFPEDSPYRKYQGAALGPKLRMHPIAAVLARIQLKHLDERNAMIVAQTKRLNDRLTQLPGLSVPHQRPDIKRVHYGSNLMLIDAAKAGMSREACAKALRAEGVSASTTFGDTKYTWQLLHTYPAFTEAAWWRHLPIPPDRTPGCDEATRTLVYVPLFTSEVPELVDQYAKAFEKVWAHRKELT